ncbi:MAG: hypothetical protein IIT65_06445 [Lachnospiraceae bacterium]|nr:hypothetical protein [Lachnospiraceae bacterium]
MFKKKLAAVVTVAALTMMSVCTAFGAESPTTDTNASTSSDVSVVYDESASTVTGDNGTVALLKVDENAITALDASGKVVSGFTLHVKNITAEQYKGIKPVVGGKDVAQADIYAVDNATGEVITLSSITLTFTNTPITTKAVVGHTMASGTNETKTGTYSNGSTTVTLTGLSPILVVDDVTATAVTTGTTSGVNTSTTSPKTGETAAALAVGIIALAGAVVCVRKLAFR